MRQDDIVRAAGEAGFLLAPLEAPIALPTMLPVAGRSTPPDFEARVLEERAILCQPAPHFTVFEMDGVTRRTLADFLAPGRPVALIFGSCT